MKPERALWNLIKEHVPGHVNRVENAAGVGTPDVEYCIDGFSAWIELKVCPRGQHDLIEHVTQLQQAWHYKRIHQAGIVWLVVRHYDTIYLLQAEKSEGWVRYVSRWVSAKPWTWSQFTAILKGI